MGNLEWGMGNFEAFHLAEGRSSAVGIAYIGSALRALLSVNASMGSPQKMDLCLSAALRALKSLLLWKL